MKVCVIGAGVSGCCAALQAARSGAECLLIEKSGLPGGTLSMCGVAIPGLFHAWEGRQVIAGIGWELVRESVDISGGTMPDFSGFDMNHFWHCQVPVNAVVFTALCDRKFKECGVDVRYHTMVGRVDKSGSGWDMTLCGKDGLFTEKADFIIDCTGDADVVRMAGFPVSAPEVCQPGTYSVRCSGYEVKDVDWDFLRAAFNAAWERGEVYPEDIGWSKGFSWLFVQRKGENANHIHCSNAPGWRSKMEISGRESLLRTYTFLKKQPGFENLDMQYAGMECGVRESRTIIGETTVNEADFVSGKIYPDAVCYGFYPVDLHDDQEGIIKTLLPEG
ncbi:MAG: FAD-dependent oxidoreductase, partial [Lentisphaeria bacterium]|nr:FAD-dependent oxidoreductase [Lentisphaeria bacterium]